MFSDLNRFSTSLRHIIPFQLIILVSFEQPLEVFTYYSCLAATEINCPPKTTLFSLLNRFNTTLRHTKPFLLKIPGISEQPVQVLTHSSCLEAKEFNSTRKTILFSVLNRFMVCPWQLKPVQPNIIDSLGNLYKLTLALLLFKLYRTTKPKEPLCYLC